jgi:hypothetical protein
MAAWKMWEVQSQPYQWVFHSKAQPAKCGSLLEVWNILQIDLFASYMLHQCVSLLFSLLFFYFRIVQLILHLVNSSFKIGYSMSFIFLLLWKALWWTEYNLELWSFHTGIPDAGECYWTWWHQGSLQWGEWQVTCLVLSAIHLVHTYR